MNTYSKKFKKIYKYTEICLEENKKECIIMNV